MSTSLSDLRANPIRSRAESRIDVCLDGELVGRLEEVEAHAARLREAAQHGSIDPKRARFQAAELREEATDLHNRIAQASGVLTIRATPDDSEWRRFVDANPARTGDDPGAVRDAHVARGHCNVDALLGELGNYAHAWNDEPLAPADWDNLFADVIAPGTRRLIAATVVGLYEEPRDFTQRWIGSPETPTGSTDSASPETSASLPGVSTGGNPAPSSTE